MEEKHYIATEIWAFVSKTWIWIVSITLGSLTKIALDILNGKKFNLIQIFATFWISFFGGYLTSIYCVANNLIEQGMWIVPLATVSSYTVMMWFIRNNRSILNHLLAYFTNQRHD